VRAMPEAETALANFIIASPFGISKVNTTS